MSAGITCTLTGQNRKAKKRRWWSHVKQSLPRISRCSPQATLGQMHLCCYSHGESKFTNFLQSHLSFLALLTLFRLIELLQFLLSRLARSVSDLHDQLQGFNFSRGYGSHHHLQLRSNFWRHDHWLFLPVPRRRLTIICCCIWTACFIPLCYFTSSYASLCIGAFFLQAAVQGAWCVTFARSELLSR